MTEDRSTGQAAKQIVSLLLGALVAVFAATNLEPATVRFFFWQVEISIALLVLLPLLVGFLLGWIQGRRRRAGAAPGAGRGEPPGPLGADEERGGPDRGAPDRGGAGDPDAAPPGGSPGEEPGSTPGRASGPGAPRR